jgi:hypothetical protein
MWAVNLSTGLDMQYTDYSYNVLDKEGGNGKK